MLKQKSLIVATLLMTFILLAGCSQSDGYSTSDDVVTDEVINGYLSSPTTLLKPKDSISSELLRVSCK